MGMFDTLLLYCEGCGGEIELQSKAGECLLDVFTLGNIPINVLADIIARNKSIRCSNCGHTFELELTYTLVRKPLSMESEE